MASDASGTDGAVATARQLSASRGFSRTVATIVTHMLLAAIAVLSVFPFVWAFLTSLKPADEISRTAGQIIPQTITFENYINILTTLAFDRWIMNSLVFTVGAVFLALLFDSLAGYALAKGRFRGKSVVYAFIVGLLIIPPQVVVLPLFLELSYLGLENTYWAMMVLFVANPFGTFMMRQFFLGVSDDLIDAARMDGCNFWQIYTRILVPIAKPALAALAVFTFVFSWQALLWPLIVVQNEAMFPIQVGLASLQGPFSRRWELILPAAILGSLPVLLAYLVARKTFMRGVTMMGGKG